MNKIDSNSLIAVTGAAGFIGSYVIGTLLKLGYTNLIGVDDFTKPSKVPNYKDKPLVLHIQREQFLDTVKQQAIKIDLIIHLGARTDTTEFDEAIFQTLNIDYSKAIWDYCTQHHIPLIYASSAATYGNGEWGYDDDHSKLNDLQPMNPYGWSKQLFDQWVLEQTDTPPFWYGLKFFNVYGPNEYHKGRMASVIFHAFNQIKSNGSLKLFRSHKAAYKDGEQIRDFIYVKDIAQIITWLMNGTAPNGIYNAGTGQARTFLALANATFKAMGHEPQIVFIDIPEDIRETYQYFTEANMQKLQAAGYPYAFTSLEDGVTDYVTNYLQTNSHH